MFNKMENVLDPIQIVAQHGAMTSKQCAEYLPSMTSKVIDAKLRQGFRVGKLSRRIDESCTTNRASYIYYDGSGTASNREPENCAILRTLGKPVEAVDGIY
jgi:hypothetical protein